MRTFAEGTRRYTTSGSRGHLTSCCAKFTDSHSSNSSCMWRASPKMRCSSKRAACTITFLAGPPPEPAPAAPASMPGGFSPAPMPGSSLECLDAAIIASVGSRDTVRGSRAFEEFIESEVCIWEVPGSPPPGSHGPSSEAEVWCAEPPHVRRMRRAIMCPIPTANEDREEEPVDSRLAAAPSPVRGLGPAPEPDPDPVPSSSSSIASALAPIPPPDPVSPLASRGVLESDIFIGRRICGMGSSVAVGWKMAPLRPLVTNDLLESSRSDASRGKTVNGLKFGRRTSERSAHTRVITNLMYKYNKGEQ